MIEHGLKLFSLMHEVHTISHDVHKAILAVLDLVRPPASKKYVKYRRLRDINIDHFTEDIKSFKLALSTASTSSELAEQFSANCWISMRLRKPKT